MRQPEPNETYRSIITDIMMYSKYRLMNGVSNEGVTDLLKKAKLSLLKFLVSNDFRQTILYLHSQ